MFKRICLAAAISILAACAAPRPRPNAPSAPVQTAASLPAPGAYKIDSDNSEVRVLVYRAGPLANLGHNHVMIDRAVAGTVQIAGSISASSFSFTVSADRFVVDDAQSRREEGSDFAAEVPENAKSGTRRNLLSAAVLNVAQFPLISVTSMALSGTPAALSALLTINVAGHASTIPAACMLQGDAHHLTATGSMQLRQSALGLTPYSLLHGALQVQDTIRLKFKIAVLIG